MGANRTTLFTPLRTRLSARLMIVFISVALLPVVDGRCDELRARS